MAEKKVEKAVLSAVSKHPEGALFKELLNELRTRGYSVREVIKAVERLEEKGLVYLEDTAPNSVRDFLLSPRTMGFWLTTAVVALTLLAIGLNISSQPEVVLRYVFGSLFVLFIPGYALIQLLYYRREDLSDLERLALSLGLSLALVPLVGLILNYTPFGIRLIPVALSLALLSMTLITLAIIRRYRYLKKVHSR